MFTSSPVKLSFVNLTCSAPEMEYERILGSFFLLCTLFLKHAGCTLALELLYQLISLHNTFPPDAGLTHSLVCLSSLLRGPLLNKTYPNYHIKDCKPPPAHSILPFLFYFTQHLSPFILNSLIIYDLCPSLLLECKFQSGMQYLEK